jgi:hypothetical protein
MPAHNVNPMLKCSLNRTINFILTESCTHFGQINFISLPGTGHSMSIKGIFRQVFLFYYEGFRNMTIGKKLWIIILIKIFIMFAVLKIFFFPNILKKNFKDDTQRGDHVIEQLSKPL